MKKLKFLPIIVLLLSCNKNTNYVAADDVFISDNIVYAVGSTCEGTSETNCPTLWIDSNVQNIGSIGNFNTAKSVFVEGSDVYVTTHEEMKCYIWKNGEKKIIDDATKLSSLFVKDRNVYIAGSYNEQPTIWINNDRKMLSHETGCVNDILVYDNDIYAVGYLGSVFNPQAVLWKNGKMEKLGNNNSEANAILIHNGSLYIAGKNNNYATLWINGQSSTLEYKKSHAYSVALLGNDIYVGGQGFDEDWRSCSRLWKNGTPLSIANEMGYQIMSVVADSEKLYIAGTGKNRNPIWIINN